MALIDARCEDLKFRGELGKCLRVLQIATTALGYTKQMSLSIVQSLVQCLIKTHLVKENDDEPIAVQKFEEIVPLELKQRFLLSATDPPPPSLIASAFDVGFCFRSTPLCCVGKHQGRHAN